MKTMKFLYRFCKIINKIKKKFVCRKCKVKNGIFKKEMRNKFQQR